MGEEKGTRIGLIDLFRIFLYPAGLTSVRNGGEEGGTRGASRLQRIERPARPKSAT